MLALIAKALFSGLSRALAKLLDLIKRYPWQVALAAALAGVWWQWSGKQDALAERDKARTALGAEKRARAADRAQWDREVANAQAERDAALLKGKETAAHAETTVQRLRADDAGLRAHIARNRLPPRPAAEASPAASGDHDPAVPADPAADPLVAITESDLRTCDAAWVYAAGANRFADELRASGLALPKPEFGAEAPPDE